MRRVASFLKSEDKGLDTTQESSGLGNHIVVKLNSPFNDTLPSASEHTPKASRSSSPSVSMHLRHIDRNLSPSPELVLQGRLAPLIMTDRTPSPSLRYSLQILLVLLFPTNPPPSDPSPTPPPMEILPPQFLFEHLRAIDESRDFLATRVSCGNLVVIYNLLRTHFQKNLRHV